MGLPERTPFVVIGEKSQSTRWWWNITSLIQLLYFLPCKSYNRIWRTNNIKEFVFLFFTSFSNFVDIQFFGGVLSQTYGQIYLFHRKIQTLFPIFFLDWCSFYDGFVKIGNERKELQEFQPSYNFHWFFIKNLFVT